MRPASDASPTTISGLTASGDPCSSTPRRTASSTGWPNWPRSSWPRRSATAWTGRRSGEYATRPRGFPTGSWSSHRTMNAGTTAGRSWTLSSDSGRTATRRQPEGWCSGTVTGTSCRTPRRGPLRPKSSIPYTSPISRMRFTRTISRAARSGPWTLSAIPSRHTADATAAARSVPSPCTRAPPSSQGPGNP